MTDFPPPSPQPFEPAGAPPTPPAPADQPPTDAPAAPPLDAPQLSVEDAIAQAVSQAQAGRVGEAINTLAPALVANPTDANANGLMGTLLCAVGRADQALPCLQRAYNAAPNHARIAYQYGAVLTMVGQMDRGISVMGRAIELEPNWVQAHIGMANTCQRDGRYEQAERLFRRAIELEPTNAEALGGLAGILIVCGAPQEAAGLFRAAAKANPTHTEILGRLASALNYAEDATAQERLEAHKAWGSAVMAAKPSPAAPPPAPFSFTGSKDPARKLRIGFLSPDLYDHSCAYFLRPILQKLDKKNFETVCYSSSARSDAMTAQLQAAADLWRDVANLPEAALIDLMRADNLDILVELSGHTASGPLAALRHRAAPVQATYLGYPNTTGLPTIDYRIVDSITDPVHAADAHTEKLVRLDGCFLCYSPPEVAPDPGSPPCLGASHVSAEAASDFASWLAPTASAPVTFGTFNSIRKFSPGAIRTWSAVLKAVPESRLLLKTRGLDTAIARKTLLRQFGAHGIGAERLGMADMVPSKAEHLAWYRQVDIALDTFPYNGTTTTCEALWMGVPVVTLEGTAHAGRVGMSLLTAAGMPELIARDEGEYVRLAAALASDPAKLAMLRASLREKLAASPLFHAREHAAHFEQALRRMWREFCQT